MWIWLLHILIDAVVLLICAGLFNRVEVRSFKTALLVALVIGIMSFLIGWLLTLLLNVATLGIFWFTGLGFVTRIIANAVIIEIADMMSKGFKTRGFLINIVLAIIIALVASAVDAIILD